MIEIFQQLISIASAACFLSVTGKSAFVVCRLVDFNDYFLGLEVARVTFAHSYTLNFSNEREPVLFALVLEFALETFAGVRTIAANKA